MLDAVLNARAPDMLRAAHRESAFEVWPNFIGAPGGVLSWETFSEIVSFREFPKGEILMAMQGKGGFDPIEPTPIFRRPIPGEINPKGLPSTFARLAAEGRTLIVNALQRHHAPVSRFCYEISALLQAKVNCNSYASWGLESPFPTHWDGHDVLVLQVEGEKNWSIFGRATDLTERSKQPDTIVVPQEPVWEGTLKKGDALYVPRGWWHRVSTGGKPSLHLTIGVSRQTSLNLLEMILRRLRASPAVWDTLEVIDSQEALHQVLSELGDRVNAAIEETTLRDLWAEGWRSFEYRRFVSLPYIGPNAPIAPDDRIALQPFIRVLPRETFFVLTDGEKKWKIPLELGRIFEDLQAGTWISGRAFREAASVTHSVDSKAEAILTDLISHGIVTVQRGPVHV